jgi:predicted permease
MSLLSEIRVRARSLFRRSTVEREMNDELRHHLEREVAGWVARGVSPDEARRRAHAEFGGIEVAREGMRDQRGVRFVEDFARDLRLGLRGLLRRPLFFGTAAVTLGLGITAATVIFSVVSMLLLRPLDAPNAERLVTFGQSSPLQDGPSPSISYPTVRDLRTLSSVFDDVVAYANEEVSITDAGREGSEVAFGNLATGNYFTMLGLRPAVGRFFTVAEEERREHVLVISHSMWMSRYAGDPGIVGRPVQVNGLPFTIIGVTPPEWHGLENLIDAQFYIPLALGESVSGRAPGMLENRKISFLRAYALLARGKTLHDARNALAVLAARIAPDYGIAAGQYAFLVEYEHRARPVIVIAKFIPAIAGTFLGLAVLALLIACVNVGNLVLARTMARGGELALRRSLGASRARVVRQLLAEALLLGAGALVVAVPLSFVVVQAIAGLKLAADIPLLIDVRLDWRVLAFASSIAVFAGIVTGLAPALRGSSARLAATMRDDARSVTGSRGRRRLGALLLTGQLAFSLVLVIAGTLFTRSLRSVTALDLGMDPDNVVMATVDLSLNRYTEAQAREYFRRATEAVGQIPGVDTVGHFRDAPMGFTQSFARVSRLDERMIGATSAIAAQTNSLDPGAVPALRLRLLEGRVFDQFDDSTAPRRALVNPEFARRMWPGEPRVVGQRFKFANDSTPIEVVGVIGAVKVEFPTEAPQPQVFQPYAQAGGFRRTIFARVNGRTDEALVRLGPVLRGIDPQVAITDLRSMHEFLHQGKAFFLYRLASVLTTTIGLLGLLQTLVGLYGVIAYGVSQRSQEFGIRVALGAARGQLVRQVMRPAAAQIGLGGVVGVVVAALTLPAAGAILAVSPRDPATYAGCTVVLVALALLALYLPARRAANAEPMRALRRD